MLKRAAPGQQDAISRSRSNALAQCRDLGEAVPDSPQQAAGLDPPPEVLDITSSRDSRSEVRDNL